MGYLIVAVVSVAIAVFAMQNTMPVTVRFLFWQFEGVPLAGVVLASLVAGVVIVGIPLWFRLWRAHGRLRALSVQPAAPPVEEEPPPP